MFKSAEIVVFENRCRGARIKYNCYHFQAGTYTLLCGQPTCYLFVLQADGQGPANRILLPELCSSWGMVQTAAMFLILYYLQVNFMFLVVDSLCRVVSFFILVVEYLNNSTLCGSRFCVSFGPPRFLPSIHKYPCAYPHNLNPGRAQTSLKPQHSKQSIILATVRHLLLS